MRSLPYEHVSKVGERLKATQAMMSVCKGGFKALEPPVLDFANKVHQAVLDKYELVARERHTR